MRITFLTHFPGRGGSTSMVVQLLRFFRSQGHDTNVVVGYDSADPLIDEYKVFNPSPGADWRQRLKEYRALVESTKPEIVYFVSGFEEADLLRFLPYVRVRHIFTLERHQWVDVPYWLGQLGAYWELCTANTPDVLEFVRKTIPLNYETAFTPYRLDAPFYELEEISTSKSVEKPLEICCIGRIENYQKRTHWLPEIIQRCRDANRHFEWHIYGAGPDEGALRQEIAKRNCSDIVRLHGWVESAAIASRASAHDIYFSCSYFEGMPVAMQEAMFCGLACVVPQLPGGIQYVAQNGGAFTYLARCAEDGVRALLEFTEDRLSIPRKRCLTRQKAHELFGKRILEEQYERLERAFSQLHSNGRIANIEQAPKIRRVRLGTYLKRRLVGLFRRS